MYASVRHSRRMKKAACYGRFVVVMMMQLFVG
jgi:hypothetical protein